MQRIFRILLASLLFLLPTKYACSADGEIQAHLMLEQMKVITATERDGDELYLDISVYQVHQPTQYLRIPGNPMHWPAASVDKIKQVPLWSQSLKPGQSVTLVVSLLDTDGSLLNPDDLIGSMRVDMKNENGVLETNWSIPNRIESLGKSDMQKFELLNDGRYDVYLSVKKGN